MPNKKEKAQHVLSPESAMAGILALLVEEREERKKTGSPDVSVGVSPW